MLNNLYHTVIHKQNVFFNKNNKNCTQNHMQNKNTFCQRINHKKLNFGNKQKSFDTEKIKALGITNMHITNENGVRGESLSRKSNKQFIPLVKECGIKRIIDLRTSDYSDRFGQYIESQGMEYYHYPIDSDATQVNVVIDSMPSLFEQICSGDFYIACAQGLHRTDIAMSINYFFNSNADCDPPVLYGHRTKNGLRIDDIFKRINSIYRALTDADKDKLGLYDLNDKTLKEKKKKLVEANQYIT